MHTVSKARAAFAIIFFAGIIGWGVWNVYSQGPRIIEGMSATDSPRSIQDVREVSDKLQILTRQNFEGKYLAWELHADIQQALGKLEMNNFSVIKAPDGRLYRGGLYPIYIEDAQKLASDIADFAEAAAENGTKILYLGTPDIVAKGTEGTRHLPVNMPYRDYNIASDALLYVLREKGVPYIDTRYSFLMHGFLPEDISPKTSLLLSGEAAFAVFTYLVEGLERRFSLALDPDGFYRDPGNYSMTLYPEFFMGELGKETGPGFSGLDDFTAVTPAFDTEFAYEALDMFGNTTIANGNAEETLLNPDALVYYENLYRLYPQSYYRHTNTTWSRVENRLNPDGPKILFIHDFYTAQVIGHLAPLCGELHTLAFQENMSASALEYIQDNNFDYVIISFFPENLNRPEMRRLVTGEEE